ncbi:hypothetical protein [Sporosarcina highlanderae]|uniref:Uncharacterized protein n=1 Tax=Sporosarcina highlanderae TaxID=3035916 RepID=A0ABT8JV29_9BACL|nr:hypothetical protein [Sporosarcina highlanderae]MDN4609000.1 hypothetical protein [Sporosarcina highlanderae]
MSTELNKIKILKASVGGFFEGNYNFEINLTTHEVLWSHWLGGEEELMIKTISAAEVKKFMRELQALRIMEWKKKYSDPRILDGTQWSLEIVTDGLTIKKSGSNQFPNEWDGFCKLIREITENEFS